MTPLPIDAVLPQLLLALKESTRAVLVAAPGAGKTTRVPLTLLGAPWRTGKILMLEPRRLAARAAASFMARSLNENVGATVGYRVRLESRVSSATLIEVVTEGIFTRMLLDDPELSGVSAVIFDEFHERSLDADLGLALALDATALRPDLRLLVMSATMDGARVAAILGEAKVIQSEGRAFSVETRYVAPDPLQRLEGQMASVILGAMREEAGSVLAFLPGQAEIARTSERLQNSVLHDVDIMPLFGQLSAIDQDRAIAPSPAGRRKVVLATSIAETSLTIEGIRIVVDSGLRRVPAYDPATGLSTLVTQRVSRAAAEQRRGRAGRTQSGVAYRLWSEGQNGALAPFDTPEILSGDLASLALDLANWGVTNPAKLSFLDQPPAATWNEAVNLLRQLDAVDEAGLITEEGRALAKLPVHPRLAHMIHRSRDKGAAAELAVLLGERGLGGDDVDLAGRLLRFRDERSPRAKDARTLARRWGGLPGEDQDVGRMLAYAFPDRVAQAAGARGRFRLANGRAATLDETEALAASQYLVVTDVTGAAATGRIRAAAAISRDDIDDLFGDRIVSEVLLSWDEASASVRARRRRTYGALILSDDPVPPPDAQAAATLLATHVVDRLPWSKEQRTLISRAKFLDPDFAFDLQDVAAALLGRTSLSEITADDLAQLLPYSLRADVERALPSHFEAPTGSRVPIDYSADAGPSVEVRVQELYGLGRHPTIANGRTPLTLVLLSPAHRPIQTTRDLPGFWRGSWKEVAKDMRGRYPRHLWPDDPASAQPTTRAKPRGT
ncbi:MAG TPA: ATP-dependent helicase HrpB [Devosia sp.]|nr:ATP-dependent helicase HrpB [Devosia sp.]